MSYKYKIFKWVKIMRYKSFKKTKSVKIISALLVVLLMFSGLQTQRSDVYAETICNNPATLEDDIKSVFQENFESMNTDPFSYTVTGEEVLKYFLKTDESGNLVEPAEMDPEKTYYIDWFFEQLFDMQDINYNAYTRLSYENISLSASSEPYYQVEDMLLTYTYTISWMDDGVGLLTPSQGREAVRAHAQEFLNSPEYPETGTDDDKLRAINEYICSTFQYDYRLFVEGEEDDVIYTAFQMINDVGQGAIGDYPRGVCQAYTMYGYVMLKEAGYEALTISGTAGDPAGPHTWNMVKVGNNWYHIDFTWNDPIRTDNPEPYVKRQSGEGSVSENYLLRSDSEISINHFWDATNEYGYSYPEALSTWASREYTVTFNSQGGSEVINVNTGSNTTITLPDTPTRTGYTFGGWYKESECINIWDFESDTVTSDITLYAKWTINQYTITFDTDGGTTIDPITQDYATSVTAPADPTKVGYTFAGWDIPVPETIPAEDVTISALWTINSYIVTFKDWDGSVLKTETVNYGSGSTAPADPQREGYTFTGWNVEFNNITADLIVTAQYLKVYTVTFSDWNGSEISIHTVTEGGQATAPANPFRMGYTFTGWDVTFINITADLIVTAQYTINQYKITFDTGGGTTIDPITQDYSTAITAPAAPTKVGYTFAGWDTEIPGTMPAEDVTITALWTINTYTVTFKNWNGAVLKTGEVDHGTAAVAPANPTRTGYTFTGWDVAFNNITSDLEVTAQYTINTYTVTFNSQSGSAVSGKTADYNTTITAPTAPTRTGFTFLGWYKEAAGTNAWDFATDKVTSNITLFAKWQSNAPENITSGSYTVNNTRLYVSKIKYETTIFAFMSKINDSNFVKAYKGTEEITGTAFICTGMLIKIMDGATVKKTYTAVVTGDINGDGKVTLTDFVQLKSHILNKSTLTGAYASAADLNGDGKITLTDFVKAKAHLLNKELITPQAY